MFVQVCLKPAPECPTCYSRPKQTIRCDFAHVCDLISDRRDLGNGELETLAGLYVVALIHRARSTAGLAATSLHQDSPSDPRQPGERNAQNIAMHARSRRGGRDC
jgi:hypothetical protein